MYKTPLNILNENAIFIAFYDNRLQDHFKIKKEEINTMNS